MSDKELRQGKTAMGQALAKALHTPIGDVLSATKKPKTKPRKTWAYPPEHCDICGLCFAPTNPVEVEFVDGKTKQGPWGIMCPDCHGSHGVGLGTGLGQKYQLEADGVWYKVAG